MKGFFYGASIFFTLFIGILAFENLNSLLHHSLFVFFSMDNINPFFVVLILAFFGIVTGFCFTMYILLGRDTGKDEDLGEDILKE